MKDVDRVKNTVNYAEWLLVTIATGVLINIISQPIVSFFN